VNIRSVDEAVVIGAALSLSSSAFVLQVFVILNTFEIGNKQGKSCTLLVQKT